MEEEKKPDDISIDPETKGLIEGLKEEIENLNKKIDEQYTQIRDLSKANTQLALKVNVDQESDTDLLSTFSKYKKK